MFANASSPEIAEMSETRRVPAPTSNDTHHPIHSHKKRGLAILVLAICVYGSLSVDLYRRMTGKSHGQFVFPLDDTYITMALAKNFALRGGWSLAHHTFQSATSTPAFLLLLAGLYRIVGPSVWSAVLLSWIFGLAVIGLAYRMLQGVRPAVLSLALLCIVLFAPLPALGLLGMEHTLHLALIFLFLPAVGGAIAARANPTWLLLVVTAVMVATRYESLFMVAFAGLFFLLQRQFRAGIALWVAGATPVALYGLISILHGCYWLPHTISLKGYSAQRVSAMPIELGIHFLSCLSRAPYLAIALVILIVLLLLPQVREDSRVRSILGIVAGAIFLHALLAEVGWVYRYEAYLVASSIAAITIGFTNRARPKWAILAVTCVGALGAFQLAERAWDAETSLPLRSAAVYFQQLQMARLLAGFEPGSPVAANDVGAINFFADIRCTDLVGLADKEIFWLKRRKRYTTDALSEIAARQHVELAMVYDPWFNDTAHYGQGPTLPGSWTRLQQWVTPYGQYVGGAVVTFYSVDPADAARLSTALQNFDQSLPKEVHVFRGKTCVGGPCL